MSRAPDDLSWRFGRSPFWAIGLLSFLYLLTRLGSLHALPIFLDESVHIQWAERLFDEGRILKPVSAGRFLAVAAYGAALPFEDRLWAARLLSALAGSVTMAGTGLLAHRLFGSMAGILAGFLYLLSPFALVYDRLALSDGFLSASVTMALFATAVLSENAASRAARAGLAVAVALAVFSKVSALLFLPAIPVGAWILSIGHRPAFKAAMGACAFGLALASPMLWFFASTSGEVSAQHLVDPFDGKSAVLLTTLSDMKEWLRAYFTWPALLAAGASAILLRDRRALWVGFAFVAPFALFALASQPWSARYVLPVLPPFLVLLSGGIASPRAPRVLRLVLALFAFLPTLKFDFDLLSDPSTADYPRDDKAQLVTGWPSGYGLRELSERLGRETAQGPVVVYLDTGGTRTVSTGLAVLLARDERIELVEGDFASADFRQVMSRSSASRRTYAVAGPRAETVELSSSLGPEIKTSRLEVFSRPGGEWAATLFGLSAVPEAR